MKNSLILFALACTCLSNCTAKKGKDVQPAGAFENKIGNNFTYAVVDSANNNNTFNVKISVVAANKTIDGLTANAWVYTYPNSVDTNYVISNIDSTVFFNKSLTAITGVYHFPLAVGNSWKQSFLTDSCYVNNVGSISTPAGSFDNAFLINEMGHSNNYIITKNQWVAPNFGIVKLNIHEINLGYITFQSWVLISYHLN